MAVKRTWMWLGGMVVAAAGLVAACGSGGGANGGGCVPGVSTMCVCAGGAQGAQVCASDGKSFGMCQCTTSTGSGGSTGTTSLTGTGGSSGCQCTNPGGESPPYCGTAVCGDAGGTGGGTTGDAGSCTGKTTFAGKTPTQFGSNWSYKAAIGLAAGNLACTDMGADHVCDYDDLVFAASKGELSALTATDTAWLQRTKSVTITATSPKIMVLGAAAVSGQTYTVGPASRCNDWNYSTDHLNDGEYVDFTKGGNSPTFNFDDNPSAIQTMGPPSMTKYIPCGHNAMLRDVLCCFPKCM